MGKPTGMWSEHHETGRIEMGESDASLKKWRARRAKAK